MNADGLQDHPLGYDTADVRDAAQLMADDALTGQTAAALEAELASVRARLDPAATPEVRYTALAAKRAR